MTPSVPGASATGFSGRVISPLSDAASFTALANRNALAVLSKLARRDPATFAAYVLRDEETGKRIKLAPVHERWHAALTRFDRLLITSFVEAGKTAQISVARALFELGENPNLRIVIVSNTSDQAKKIVRNIGQYIQKSPELHKVFPHLVPNPDPALPWAAQSLTVARTVLSRDPSVQAIGIGGPIMGSRIDRLIIDDILDYENTRTQHQMDQVFGWLRSSAIGRLTSKAKVWAVTNSWHPKDHMNKLVSELRYKHLVTQVMDSNTGELAWPERWSRERIRKARRDLGPLEFGRQLMCEARDDEQARFQQAWIDVALDRGTGYSLVKEVSPGDIPDGYAIFTGVDLAVQKHASADLTVFFTILLWPDGTRQVLYVESGRYHGPEIVKRIDDIGNRYGGIVIVENNAAQDYILQFSNVMSRATVRGFRTGRNKADPVFGVAGMATEMEAGRWLIPISRKTRRIQPEVSEWINDMLYYNPKEHTGDRLMAAWLAREGCRQYERSLGRTYNMAQELDDGGEERGGGVRVLG